MLQYATLAVQFVAMAADALTPPVSSQFSIALLLPAKLIPACVKFLTRQLLITLFPPPMFMAVDPDNDEQFTIKFSMTQPAFEVIIPVRLTFVPRVSVGRLALLVNVTAAVCLMSPR